MKRLKLLLFIILLIILALALYKYDLYTRRDQNRDSGKLEDTAIQYGRTVAQIDEAAIIRKALKTIGVLAVLEGEEQYKQIIEEENWYSYRGINIDWHYRFAIAMDLEDIGISINEGSVELVYDKEKLFVQFIEKTRDSKSHSEASWFARKYSSQELNALEKAVSERVEIKIHTTPAYWETAENSLKERLTKICSNLGYQDIVFAKAEP